VRRDLIETVGTCKGVREKPVEQRV